MPMRATISSPDAGPDAGHIRAEHDRGLLVSYWGARLVSPSPVDQPAMPEGALVWSWTGGMGEDLFEEEPRTWMGQGAAALDASLDRLRPLLEARGVRLLLRTHAAHALGDIPSGLRLLREREGQPFGLLLDPVAMLTFTMRDDAPDHFARIAQALAGQSEGIVIDTTDAALAGLLLDALERSPLRADVILACPEGAPAPVVGRVAAIAARD